jgi:hypothetical protein
MNRRLLCAACALLLAGPVLAADPPCPTSPPASSPPLRTGVQIGALTDPQEPGIRADLDIVAASITQDGGRLTFAIDTRGPIPTTLPNPDDTFTYLWFVDTDENPATGQPHGGLGSEFNVRAVISGNWGGGYVDVCGEVPGGGVGDVVIAGSRITITVWLAEIGAPADFNWRCATLGVIGGNWLPANGETQIVHSDTLPYTPPARVAVVPPILTLCPTGPATGQLQLLLRDAQGNILPTAGHTLAFSSTNEGCATVSDNGLVTAIAPPEVHWQTPYIQAWADGVMADNAAVVRVNDMDLGVAHQPYPGTQVVFYVVPQLEGVDLDAIMRQYEVVQATDRAFGAEAGGVGAVPNNDGGTQYMVLEVTNDPVTCPCGASGNPARFGWVWGQPLHNSCFIVNDDPGHRVPQWFVLFHELGHNFTCACNSFNLFCSGPSTTQNVAYVEGCASLAAMWAWQNIETEPEGLGPLALADIEQHFQGNTGYFRQQLAAYQAAGADYDVIDANVVDGIFCEMHDAYGPKAWFDLFSTFLPSTDPLPIALTTVEQQATWIVAALSVSAGTDLRALFTSEYGFPIDDTAWPAIRDAVQQRIEARPFATGVGDPMGPPAAPALCLAISPNPFETQTRLRFVLPRPGAASVTVHDLSGRWIATLLEGPVAAGERSVAWDGRAAAGQRAATGIYLIRLVTADGTSERKVTLLR